MNRVGIIHNTSALSENPGVSRTRQRSWPTRCAALLAASLSLSGLAASHKEQNRAEADAFLTNGTILRVSVEITEEDIESLRKTPREYVRATLREGNTTHSNVAVHLKGGSGSFRKVDDRPGLTLDFNRFESGGRFLGLKKLHLNNSAQDPTRLSEMIGEQLFREAGVPAARVAHVLLDLNRRQLGLYVAMESMDKDFLSRYFKDPGGNLYGQTRGGDIDTPIERMEGNEPLTHADLKALAAAIAEADPQLRMERMEKALDMERFLSFMSMEVILGHTDSYTFARHNYRVYQDVDTDRMVFLPHDLDQLMRRQAWASPPR